MKWITVKDSANVTGFSYDKDSSTLTVEFVGKARYEYADVPLSVFNRMRKASSKGTFVSAHVKGQYQYSKIN